VRSRSRSLLLGPSVLACAVLAGVLSGCSDSNEPPPDPAVASAPLPGVTLPPDELRDLVPTPAEVPPGLTPLLTATGPRDAAAVAAYSADPAAAGKALKAHGFRKAYVAQYANPGDGRVVSVVVVRFATAKGATDDLSGDIASSGGTKLSIEKVGEASSATSQALPDGGGELVTLRFRSGPTTWLVAYGAKPKADPAIAVRLAKAVLSRATT
jgi:hypothetical protein